MGNGLLGGRLTMTAHNVIKQCFGFLAREFRAVPAFIGDDHRHHIFGVFVARACQERNILAPAHDDHLIAAGGAQSLDAHRSAFLSIDVPAIAHRKGSDGVRIFDQDQTEIPNSETKRVVIAHGIH
jgi:hypothetical protein